jgi:glutathione S-transferase
MSLNHNCVLTSTCSVWTAGSITLTPWSGVVPLGIFVLFLVNLWMAFQVGAARKKFGVSYPHLYAVAGQERAKSDEASKLEPAAAQSSSAVLSAEEAFQFNCVQRGHQNSIENYPLVLASAIIAWGFPIPAGFALISWALGRIPYMIGYQVAPEKRTNALSILLTYPALLTLLGLDLATAIFLFQGTKPYSY